jgi:hypothetical protein
MEGMPGGGGEMPARRPKIHQSHIQNMAQLLYSSDTIQRKYDINIIHIMSTVKL